MKIIEIENLTLTISRQLILNSVSLDIFEGDFLSIIGPNGAGKTSLLKCVMRIYSDYEGVVRLLGTPIDQIRQKKLAQQISYVPQANGRVFPFTIAEFVMMGRYPHLNPFTAVTAEDRRAVRESLEITGMARFADRQMNTLSGGERQIAFIAAALAQGAGIMLLDEPTTFLDPKHEAGIHTILRKLNQEMGMTIVTVTHDINSAVLQSDRIVILKGGKVMFQGRAAEIMNNDILHQAYDKSFTLIPHPQTGQMIIAPEVHR